MLPITGYPFGPGGYGNLALRRLLRIKTKDAATASKAPPRGEMDTMEDGGGGRFGLSAHMSVWKYIVEFVVEVGLNCLPQPAVVK